MWLFGKKDKDKSNKEKKSPKEVAFTMANNVFKNTLLDGEVIEHAIQGKGEAKNLIFSAGILGATDKRLLYYFQDGSETGVETIMYDKIVSITNISGFEGKMGNFIGVAVELANGRKRIVRCLDNDDQKKLINELIFYIESKR